MVNLPDEKDSQETLVWLIQKKMSAGIGKIKQNLESYKVISTINLKRDFPLRKECWSKEVFQCKQNIMSF